MRILHLVLGVVFVLVLSGHAKVVAGQRPLVGNWRLVSFFLIIDNGKPQGIFGQHPKGSLILTSDGRMMALGTSDTRKIGAGDTERAELWKSMFAYSGKYRIEGADFITTVDVSWNEEWNGSEQKRHYKLERNRLTIVTPPSPSPLDPSQTVVATLVWERER